MGYKPGTLDDGAYQQRRAARIARQACEAARAVGTQPYGAVDKIRGQQAVSKELETRVSAHDRRISALEQSGLAGGPVTRLLETETDGWGVAGAATVASVTVPVVAGYSPSVVSVSVSGAAARRGAGRLRASVVCAGSTARIRTSAVPVGDGRAYPGVSATECVIGMSGHLRVPAGERVDLSLVASGSAWPASPSNWVRLTARVDYVRSVL